MKSRNILVDENLNGKVADFGLSRLKDEDAGMTACGTPAWTAPEVVRMEDYSEKVDVYSFAIVLWELIMRDEPYSGEGGIQIAYAAAEQGLRPDVPDHIPSKYAELMKECWADSPHDRPGFGQILTRLFQMMKDESNPDTAPKFYFGNKIAPLKDVNFADFFTKEELLEHGIAVGTSEDSPNLKNRVVNREAAQETVKTMEFIDKNDAEEEKVWKEEKDGSEKKDQ